MPDPDHHLEPFYSRVPVEPSPNLGPTSRYSGEITPENGLVSSHSADHEPSQQLGDSVPHAPARLQEVPAEDPTHATNSRLISLAPKVIDRATAKDQSQYDDLKYWPTILQNGAVAFLVLLYTANAVGIGVLTWKSFDSTDHSFRLSSENVHMVSRYFPSILGTITVLFFRQTVREALRMVPFVSMADQNYEETAGSQPWKGVGGSWFPWQSITTTPKSFMSIFSLLCQFAASFIVSLKVALLASVEKFDQNMDEPYWILSVRVYPAILLIAGNIMMIVYTLYVSWYFRGKSTGLKWDPMSIADYASLFAHCNALQYFAPLELRHDLRPKHVMVPNRYFRLGYWNRKQENAVDDVVYGIGVGYSAHTDTGRNSQKERDPLGRPWQHVVTFQKAKPSPNPIDLCKRPRQCAQGIWPGCEHYPYNHNPGCARWVIALASIFPIGALVLSIYALVIRLPYSGFSFPNTLKLPSGFYLGHGSDTYKLPPIDPTDPNSTVLLWVLIFRSAPTYIAGLFTTTIVTWIDLNMRFMQPFRNMFGEEKVKKTIWRRLRYWLGGMFWRASPGNNNDHIEEERIPAKASESILLAYITASPLQVPLTAWDKGHFKVCIYSTLSTLSPLFPIFAGGLLTVTPDQQYDRVNFSFSLSAYIGTMVSLGLYSILLPNAMPGAYRLLPRQLYSLADLMAMCHESKFMASPHLDITHRDRTPSKAHMEGRILLTDDRFLFGVYQGRDEKGHIGFDVAQEREPDFGKLKTIKNSVRHIPPDGFVTRFQRAMTSLVEEGKKATGRAMTGMAGNAGSPFSQRARGVSPEEDQGIPLMSGGLGGAPARAHVSGSEPRQVVYGGRTRTARFELAGSPHQRD